MEEIEITIVNWNTKQEWGEDRKMKEEYRHYYFKLSNRIYGSYSLKDLTGDEFRCWIGLLCLASQEKSGTFRKTTDWICWELRIEEKTLNSCLEKLQCNSTVAVLRHNCDSSERKSRVEKSREEKMMKGKDGERKESSSADPSILSVKQVENLKIHFGSGFVEKRLGLILAEIDASDFPMFPPRPLITRVRQMLEAQKKRDEAQKTDKKAGLVTGPIGGVRV